MHRTDIGKRAAGRSSAEKGRLKQARAFAGAAKVREGRKRNVNRTQNRRKRKTFFFARSSKTHYFLQILFIRGGGVHLHTRPPQIPHHLCPGLVELLYFVNFRNQKIYVDISFFGYGYPAPALNASLLCFT